jgi:predicted AAA+ superfamily ATPase
MDVANHSPESNNKSTSLSNEEASNKSSCDRVREFEDERVRYKKNLILKNQRGRIELIMGPMFAGKSTELLRRVNRLEISGKKVLNVKYVADSRYSCDSISTHDK